MIKDILDIIPTPNSFELVALFVGAFTGIVFGLRGWRGNRNEPNLKIDPRLENLKWVFGPLFIGYIADMKSITGKESIDKLALLAWYTVPLFSFIFITLIILYRSIKTDTNEKIKTIAPSLRGDKPSIRLFWVYGLDYYEEELKKFVDNSKKTKLESNFNLIYQYTDILTQAIIYIQQYLVNTDKAEIKKKEIYKELLKIICSVTKLHCSDDFDLVINANYMRAFEYKSQVGNLQNIMKFHSPDLANIYEYILHTEEYAQRSQEEKIALPVVRSSEVAYVLPGAPSAFIEKYVSIINDTSEIKLSKDLKLKKEIKDYFKTKRFKSFASICVVHDNLPMGVVNIEVSKVNAFGLSKERHENFISLINPVCQLFSLLPQNSVK